MDNWDLSRVKVGGDIAGALVVIGSFVVVLAGIPSLRGLMAYSVAGGVLLAALLFVWHRRRRNRPIDPVHLSH